MTSRPLLRHTRRRLHRGGNELSLSLSRSVHNFTTIQQLHIKLCPKSYLYLYDFSAYLHFCPSDRFGTDRGRFCSKPVLYILHPVPSGGTCFPTKSSAKPSSSSSILSCRPSRQVNQICRVVTRVRGERRDHGGLGLRNNGDGRGPRRNIGACSVTGT